MAYKRNVGMKVRIARFQNCYGPYGTWTRAREKAPAAMCRKVVEVVDGGTIEVWGDGAAMRTYTYVDDMVDGIVKLMHSEYDGPVNIGSEQKISVRDLVQTVAEVADNTINIQYVDGPVGVQARNQSSARAYAMGWECRHSLRDGIAKTYPWIGQQVMAAQTVVLGA